MNKLKYLLLIIPFLFIGSVKAESVEFDYTNKYVSHYGNQGFSYIDLEVFYTNYDNYSQIVNRLYDLVYNYYIENYQNEYPYYFVSMIPWTQTGTDYVISSDIDDFYIHATLFPLKSVPTYSTFKTYENNDTEDFFGISATYTFASTTYNTPLIYPLGSGLSVTYNSNIFTSFPTYKYPYVFNPLVYYISNFNLVFDLDDTYIVKEDSSILYTFNNGDIIPTYFGSSGVEDSYVEINLNDYAYVALSLKDYSQNAFSSRQYVKGEYCINGVYDYGLSSKEKYDSSITDICSPYYDVFTPIDLYVRNDDLKYHAIYYLKAHDISKENKIRVDSSVFNIHYITEEEADNPVININGRNYSILPFDELPSNSIKNTEEGFVPGASEEFSFSDIFTAPLEFLKDVWNSIVNVFDLIIEFIYLLPKELQGFLIASFYLAVSIGLLKILL